MKHFAIVLTDKNRQTRAWSVWSERLTIGADPRCDIVMPLPAEPLVGVFDTDSSLDLPFGRLEITEDTPWRHGLWASARERIARSRLLAWREPGADSKRLRAAVYASLAMFALAGTTGLVWLGLQNPGHAQVAETTIDIPIFEVVAPVPQEPEPEPEYEVSRGADQPVTDDREGGPTESRTEAWPPVAPPEVRGVMDRSVLAQVSTAADGIMGDPVDAADEPSAVDVILANGGGGSLQKGPKGGLAASSDGDRMPPMGGVGLGRTGRAGAGVGAMSRPGPLLAGRLSDTKGTGIKGRIAEPSPRDMSTEIGSDAGTRSPESILRVIRSHIGGFRYAYEKYLRENPNLGGKLSLKFTIAPSGDIVAMGIVASNTGNATLDGEIKEKAARMKFDAIEKGNVTVTYAFVLDKQ